MIILKNDKVVLIKEFGNLQTVGETYEVANITDTAIVIRDVSTKIAVGAVDISDFYKYFKKPDEVKGWTEWKEIRDADDDIFFYRTNQKRVQVKSLDNIRAESSCNQKDNDEFNLHFGLTLAYLKCKNKTLKQDEENVKDYIKRLNKELENIYSKMAENKNQIKRMMRYLDDKVNTEK